MTIRRFVAEIDDTRTSPGDPFAGVIAVQEAAREQPITQLPTASQSITFGADLPTSFVDALMGLATGWVQGEGQAKHVVGISTFGQDWTSVEPPRTYILEGVVRAQDMGEAKTALEGAEGYVLLTPADERNIAIPGPHIVIIPASRIARLHVH